MKWEPLSITMRIVAVFMAFLMLGTSALGLHFVYESGLTRENGLFAVAALGAGVFGIALVLAALVGRSPRARTLAGINDHQGK